VVQRQLQRLLDFSRLGRGAKHSIIRASELSAAGLVAGPMTSLAFDVVAVGQTYQGFNVQLGHTTATVMTTTFLATPMTQVYRGH
jgi:hypothetical protein